MLKRQRCLVVGGRRHRPREGRGAARCDADVTLVAPEVVPQLADYAREGSIEWQQRAYEEADLEGALM